MDQASKIGTSYVKIWMQLLYFVNFVNRVSIFIDVNVLIPII